MKKITSILILILVMFQTVAFAYSDVSDAGLTSKLDELSKYNIINGYQDGTFKPNNNITRAEFSKMVMVATMNDYVDVDSSQFADVTPGFWAEKYIYAAKTLGVVNGTTETTFAPEANITNEQAVKMIVASLGYNEEAVEAGGYPNGYIKVAGELGIIDLNNFDGSKVSTRKEIAEMVYNSMNIKFYFLYLDENGNIMRSEAENTMKEIHEISVDNAIDLDVIPDEKQDEDKVVEDVG